MYNRLTNLSRFLLWTEVSFILKLDREFVEEIHCFITGWGCIAILISTAHKGARLRASGLWMKEGWTTIMSIVSFQVLFLGLLYCSCSSTVVSDDSEGYLIELTDTTFDDAVAKPDFMIIEFYSTWLVTAQTVCSDASLTLQVCTLSEFASNVWRSC